MNKRGEALSKYRQEIERQQLERGTGEIIARTKVARGQIAETEVAFQPKPPAPDGESLTTHLD